MNRLPALLIVLSLAACASPAPPGRTPQAVPAWMEQVPVDPDYFIGIGGTPDTGERQHDLERARGKALAQLAAEIEVMVRSDQTFRETESSAGSSSTTAEIIVRTLTEENLEGVELVDSFHSLKDGYWFYFRLAKRTWDWIKNRDIYELRDRILAMVARAEAPGSSVADRLRALAFAQGLLSGSPHAGRIVAQIGGATGVLDDLIRKRLEAILAGMSVRTEPTSVRCPVGGEIAVRLQVSSTVEAPLGALPMEIRGPDGTVLGLFQTGSDGRCSTPVRLTTLKTGKRQATIGLSPQALEGAGQSTTLLAPRASLEIEVLPLGVHLELAGPDTLDSQWLRDSLSAMLMDRYALAVLRAEAVSQFQISFVVRSRNTAANEYGIEFAYCSLSMIVTRDESQISAFTSREFKGAGISPDQASRNAAKAMLESLPGDPDLGDAVTVLVSSVTSESP